MIDGLSESDIFYRAIRRPRTLHSEEKFIEFLGVVC